MSITKFDFDKICRTCLEYQENMITIFDADILKMFHSCTTITIEKNDLPSNLCLTCLSKINDAYCFNKQCENVNLKLHAILNETSLQLDEDDDDNGWFDHELSSSELQNVQHESEHIEKNVSSKHHKFSKQQTFQCTVCNKVYNQAYKLRKHAKIHSTCKPYHCTECNKDFKYLDSYRNHRRRRHLNQSKSKCRICDKEVLHLKAHNLRKHTTDKPFKCTECSTNYATELLLRCHIKITHEKLYATKKALCNICGFKCLNNNALDKHLQSHSDEKPFKCLQCTKSFKLRSGLMEHQATHKDERPYQCQQCDKAFKQSKTLKRHLIIHTGERPYKCNVCDKRFNQNSILRTHMKVHSAHSRS